MSLNYNLLVSEVDFRRKKDAKKMKKSGKKFGGKEKRCTFAIPFGKKGYRKRDRGEEMR